MTKLKNLRELMEATKFISHFKHCPDEKTTSKVAAENIEDILKEQKRFSASLLIIWRMSEPTQPNGVGKSHLAGGNRYAADSYAIFCTGQWIK
ncbi:hypothetical protein C5167_020102 [Papaver somniferum]|uniref:Uncharacterized protein n=1 Tax=Papaver somniferum TaxID=3469 RepID=A0A4Y7IV72_PAPSO|nr:hypothetical protein C5167_020102 [Papaver somniferum]